MAYQIGTVDNYRQLLKMFATFVTTNVTLVGLGQEWALNTGRISTQAVEYLEHTSFVENGLMQWDKAVAMGWDDTYASTLFTEGYYGWRAYTTDLPAAYLGYESAAAVLPDHYIITALHWDAGTSEADQQPETWFLEHSDDDTIWTEGDDVSTSGGGTYGDQTLWASQEARSFDVPTGLGTHVYWRLRFVTNNGDTTYLSLGRLRFYNSTPDWISYSYSNEYQFVAPGLTTTEEIYSGIRLHESPVSDYFNWQQMGSIGYNSDADFSSQPFSKNNCYTLLYDQPLKYWLCANGQRAAMVIKVSTVYQFIYIGKILPYATPAQYPYPFLLAGSTSYAGLRWSSEVDYHSCFPYTDHERMGAALLTSSNQWADIEGRANPDLYSGEIGVLPVTLGSIGSTQSFMRNSLPNLDGSYCIFPYILISDGSGNTDKGVLGEAEGVFWVSGNGNLSENILNIDGQDYLVFQNVFRSNYYDYSVLELK